MTNKPGECYARIMKDSYQKTANRISLLCMVCNLVLSAAKLAAGIAGTSTAMVSDAVHSFSDALGDVIAMIGVQLSEKEPDEGHPYGHERIESVASVIIGILLLLAGLTVGRESVEKILSRTYEAEMPGMIAMVAAVVSIAVKEGMYHLTMRAAKRLDSNALRAEAWHNRSDAVSSVGALIGIWFARSGFPLLDPVAGFVISLFILRASFLIFRDSFRKMVDHSGDAALEEEIKACALSNKNVRGIDVFRSREFGRWIYVDMEIRVDKTISLEQAHAIAHEVHDLLETRFPVIKHVMIHVNPD